MTRYRLPEALGGGEFEASEVHAQKAGFVSGEHVVWIPVAWLTKVEPPLPPEPPLWAVVVDKHERVWQHVSDGRGEWTCTVADLGAEWDELQEYAPLVRLVPDPAAGVELPWDRGLWSVRTSHIGIEAHVVIQAPVGQNYVSERVSVDVARELAGVLLAAADAAEAVRDGD